VLLALQKKSKGRSVDDIKVIINTLIKTNVTDLISETKNDSLRYTFFLYTLAKEIRYELVKKGETVFKIGEKGEKFYVIISGSMQVLKLNEHNVYWSYEEYLNYLSKLKINKEIYVLKKALSANKEKLNIDVEIIEYAIESIFVRRLVNFLRGVLPNLQEIRSFFTKYNKDLLESTLNFEELEKLEKEEKDIKTIIASKASEAQAKNLILNANNDNDENNKIFENSNEVVNNALYEISEKINLILSNYITNLNTFLKNNNFEIETDLRLDNPDQYKNFKCFSYSEFMTIKQGCFFGDKALEDNMPRNATLVAKYEDTHLAVVGRDFYKDFILAEKNKLTSNKVELLYNCLFNQITKRKQFEKKYFNFFIYEEFYRNQFLCKENEILKYVYFIEEGEIEITAKKNYFELEENINTLMGYNPEIINEVFVNNDSSNLLMNFDLNKNENKYLKESLKARKNFVVKKISKNDLFGIENIMYNIPSIYSAFVKTNKLCVFKIESKTLKRLISSENEGEKIFKSFSNKKIASLIHRLYQIQKGMVEMEKIKNSNAQDKHIHNNNSSKSGRYNNSSISNNKSNFSNDNQIKANSPNKLNFLQETNSGKETFKNNQSSFRFEENLTKEDRISVNKIKNLYTNNVCKSDQDKYMIDSPDENLINSKQTNDLFLKKFEAKKLDINMDEKDENTLSDNKDPRLKSIISLQNTDFTLNNNFQSLSRNNKYFKNELSDKFLKFSDKTFSSEYSSKDKMSSHIKVENLKINKKVGEKSAKSQITNDKDMNINIFINNKNEGSFSSISEDSSKLRCSFNKYFQSDIDMNFNGNANVNKINLSKIVENQGIKRCSESGSQEKKKVIFINDYYNKDQNLKRETNNSSKVLNQKRKHSAETENKDDDFLNLKFCSTGKFDTKEEIRTNCLNSKTKRILDFEKNSSHKIEDFINKQNTSDNYPNENKKSRSSITNLKDIKDNLVKNKLIIPSLQIRSFITMQNESTQEIEKLPNINQNEINTSKSLTSRKQTKGYKTESTNTDRGVIKIFPLNNNAYKSLSFRNKNIDNLNNYQLSRTEEIIDDKNSHSVYRKNHQAKETDFPAKNFLYNKNHLIMNNLFFKSAKIQLEKKKVINNNSIKTNNKNSIKNKLSSADNHISTKLSMINLNNQDIFNLNIFEKFKDTVIYDTINRNFSSIKSEHVNRKRNLDQGLEVRFNSSKHRLSSSINKEMNESLNENCKKAIPNKKYLENNIRSKSKYNKNSVRSNVDSKRNREKKY